MQNLTLCNFVLPEPIITKVGMIDYIDECYWHWNSTLQPNNTVNFRCTVSWLQEIDVLVQK